MNKICGYSCEHNKGGVCQIPVCDKKLIMSDKTELKENYERVYNENCKLREEHNITDISLLDENQELKQKYLNAVADYETTMFEKEQLNNLVNSCQEEIRQLKKQVEDTITSYTKEHNMRHNSDLKLDVLKTQQKEFIKYLENLIKQNETVVEVSKYVLPKNCSKLLIDFYKVILSKYKEIIGVSK